MLISWKLLLSKFQFLFSVFYIDIPNIIMSLKTCSHKRLWGDSWNWRNQNSMSKGFLFVLKLFENSLRIKFRKAFEKS
uniref:Putative ovule protein n=1 Tax=Solanum chacoense TaxID=4108 RepID=A0A0V0I3F9_SOLCH